MAKKPHHKHLEDLEKLGVVRLYKLRCITDGSEQTFVDEGPFETNPNFRALDPSGGRQNLIRTLRKVDAEDNLPIFVADKPGQKPVYDRATGNYIPVPLLDRALLRKLEQNLNDRKITQGTARQLLAQAKADLEDKVKQGAQASVVKTSTLVDAQAAANAGGPAVVVPPTETVDAAAAAAVLNAAAPPATPAQSPVVGGGG